MASMSSLQNVARDIDPAALEALREQISKYQVDKSAPEVKKDVYADGPPSRVSCIVPVKVVQSILEGAGRGLIVLEDVIPGQLIFKIAEPLLATVDGGFALAHTCDNCFASINSNGVSTAENIPKKFAACTGCNILHYCGKECQKEAWERHHKLDCKTLKKMQVWEGPDEKIVLIGRIRQVVRLIRLHTQKDYPTSPEWAEIIGLSKHVTKDLDVRAATREIAAGLEYFTETDLSKDEIVDLLFALQNNEFGLTLPLLRPHDDGYIPDTPISLKSGIAMDPFMALVNHSCQPNVVWNFEGRELRVTAIEPISAGDEIYITYVDSLGDYYKRRSLLLKTWSFDCACQLCKQGPKGLNAGGELGKRVLKLKEGGWPNTPERFDELKRALSAVESAGYGPGTYPIRWFYQCIWGSQALHGDPTAALKTCLKLYFEIEPAHKPNIDPEDHESTLYHMINLLKGQGAIGDISKPHVAAIYKHFRHLHVKNMAKIFGTASKIAVFERDGFEKWSGENKVVEVSRSELVENIELLLKWAAIPEVSESMIMGT